MRGRPTLPEGQRLKSWSIRVAEHEKPLIKEFLRKIRATTKQLRTKDTK